MENVWYYKVTIIANGPHADAENPDFRFKETEKEKLTDFIFICLGNGHEISVVHTNEEFDK